jgi:predicted CoA-binding protein
MDAHPVSQEKPTTDQQPVIRERMDDQQITQILKTMRRIAVVGLSNSPEKASHEVAAYLQKQGYEIVPVNPNADQILGEKAYPDLLSIQGPIDVVDIFRPSKDVPPIVDQAIQIGAKAVWMQQGIVHPDAAQKAEAAGLQVVMNRCLKTEHLYRRYLTTV